MNDEDNPPATGARARSLTADEQREHIVAMILRKEWHPGAAHKELAEKWGCSVRTVSNRALEAMHAVRVGLATTVKDWVAQAFAELDALQEDARKLGKPRDAAYCIELKGKMLGAFVTKVQEVPAEPKEAETEAELWARIDKLREEREKKDGVH